MVECLANKKAQRCHRLGFFMITKTD